MDTVPGGRNGGVNGDGPDPRADEEPTDHRRTPFISLRSLVLLALSALAGGAVAVQTGEVDKAITVGLGVLLALHALVG